MNCPNYFEPCYYSTRLLEKLRLLDTKNVLDFDLINKAIYWAKKYHGDQKRKSGEPYYSHPLEVAYMISEYKLKTDVIVASILHDIIEDTEVTAGMILDHFSWRIAKMVDRLTRDRPDGSKLSVEQVLNNSYQLKDNEVLLIKTFDRLHNLQNIHYLTEEKQIATARETIDTVLIAVAYLEDNKTEFAIGTITNSILNYKARGNILNYKSDNSSLGSTYLSRFISTFEF